MMVDTPCATSYAGVRRLASYARSLFLEPCKLSIQNFGLRGAADLEL
jgi:hypothetical protein